MPIVLSPHRRQDSLNHIHWPKKIRLELLTDKIHPSWVAKLFDSANDSLTRATKQNIQLPEDMQRRRNSSLALCLGAQLERDDLETRLPVFAGWVMGDLGEDFFEAFRFARAVLEGVLVDAGDEEVAMG